MRLATIRLKNVGPFGDTTLRFTDGDLDVTDADDHDDHDASSAAAAGGDDGGGAATPRPVIVLFGGDGTGKTTLLSALSVTRPGHALPPLPQGRERAPDSEPAYVATEWILGEDDPERPHPLVVTSPTAVLDGEAPEIAAIRRREQTLFDRRAQNEGGFVFVAFSGARWFSRNANMLSTPERSVLRYDVRVPASFDDPTRADLTRETKQALSYAAIARALGEGRGEYMHLAHFDAAMREVVAILLEPFGFEYAGVSPTSLEPEARDAAGRVGSFDALPRSARHLVAFGALSLRALFAAYPRAQSPREREGVVAIDDVESQQDPALLRGIVPLLRRALPNVQWILTTASTQLATACGASDEGNESKVIALRRVPGDGAGIEVGEGVLH